MAATGLVLSVASPAMANGNGKGAGTAEHVPVNVCHATSSDTNPYVFITVDDDSTKFQGHLMHREEPNKRWKSNGVFDGVAHQKGDPKPDLIGSYTGTDGVYHQLDGDITAAVCAGLSLTTSATSASSPSGSIHDVATVRPDGATGSVSFAVYGPFQAGEKPVCETPKATFNKVALVNGKADSGEYRPAAAGHYYWVATYDSGATYGPGRTPIVLKGGCGDPGETSTVAKARPTIITTASDATLVDGKAEIKDQGTISGLFGEGPYRVQWAVYSGDCKGSSVAHGDADVSADGTFSMSQEVTQPGDYHWVVTFAGDDDNEAALSPCYAANETSTVTDGAIPEGVSLTIVKDGTERISAGGDITYTVVVTNVGDTATRGFTVRDTLPVGTTFGQFISGDGWTTDAQEGASGQITFLYSAPAEHPLGHDAAAPTLTFTAHTMGAVDMDSVTNNACVSWDEQTACDPATTIIDKVVDLKLTKSAPEAVNAGEDITYTVTVSNEGPSTADKPFTVNDTLPFGTSYVGGSLQGAGWSTTAVDGATGSIGFSYDGAALGSATTFTYRVSTVGAGDIQQLTNHACVDYSGDSNTDNNCADAPTTVTPVWDLGITKSTTATSVRPGAAITYTVTVTNYGPSSAEDVRVKDFGGAGLTDVTVTAPEGWTEGDGWFHYDGALAVGSAQVFTVSAKAADGLSNGSSVMNRACVEQDNAGLAIDRGESLVAAAVVEDSYPLVGDFGQPNCASVSTRVSNTPVTPPPVNPPPVNPPTDVVNPSILGFTKDVNKSEAKVGQTLHYSMTATVEEGPNNGVARQDNVKIVDPLPQGITYVTDSAACTTTTKVDPPRKVTCSVTYDKGTRTVAAKADTWLQVGDTLELDFNATVDKDATKIHNVATASSDDVDAVQASADTSVTAVEGVIIEKPPVQQPGTVAPGTEAPGTVAQPATLPHTGADGSRLPLAGLVLIGLGLAMVVGSRRRAAGEA